MWLQFGKKGQGKREKELIFFNLFPSLISFEQMY